VQPPRWKATEEEANRLAVWLIKTFKIKAKSMPITCHLCRFALLFASTAQSGLKPTYTLDWRLLCQAKRPKQSMRAGRELLSSAAMNLSASYNRRDLELITGDLSRRT